MTHPESTEQTNSQSPEQAQADSQDNDRNVVDDSNSGVDEFFGTDPRVQELLDKLKAAETEVLKSHAEAENFRKRIQRDAEQQLRYANMPLMRDLLDVVDNLKRATESATGTGADPGALLNGVQMVMSQLTNILTKFACKPIEAVGQAFDPNIHEAIAHLPHPEIAAGNVMQEVAVGYMLHDRVIRPAQVIVSKGST